MDLSGQNVCNILRYVTWHSVSKNNGWKWHLPLTLTSTAHYHLVNNSKLSLKILRESIMIFLLAISIVDWGLENATARHLQTLGTHVELLLLTSLHLNPICPIIFSCVFIWLFFSLYLTCNSLDNIYYMFLPQTPQLLSAKC